MKILLTMNLEPIKSVSMSIIKALKSKAVVLQDDLVWRRQNIEATELLKMSDLYPVSPSAPPRLSKIKVPEEPVVDVHIKS